MKNRFLVLILSLIVMLLIVGCRGRLNTNESLPASTAEKDLQAIYLSNNNGYFSAAEIDKLSHAKMTDDFTEFIRLADQFPEAVLFIDNNAIQNVEVQKLKETMTKNERMLMVGYDGPNNKIGLEEYWDKPGEEFSTNIPQRGFCQFILVTQEMHYDFPEMWQRKLPLLYRNDCYAFHKTMNEQMTGLVKNKMHYESAGGQKYKYTWESSPDQE